MNPTSRAPVSVIVPTLNEQRNIRRCLEHLRWADEVVVVDSGSTDATGEIAAELGAAVIDFRWNRQWPKKKNWALRSAPLRNEWVLIVDADEVVVPELGQEISDAVRSTEFLGYYINRRFMFLGNWIKHCGYYPSWNLRLFKRYAGEYERLTGAEDTRSGDNEVHEHVRITGRVGHLKHDMLHFAFPDVHTFVEKHNRYSNWEATMMWEQRVGRLASDRSSDRRLSMRRRLREWSRGAPFKSSLRFLYSYVVERGFLDGRAGYHFCRLLAVYEYLSEAKYYEMEVDSARVRAEGPIRKPNER